MSGWVVGATVLTVIAADADRGNNGSLTYSLVNVPRHAGRPMFTIDRHNGLISTRQSNVLDRELTDQYQLTVLATDRGNPPLSGTPTSLSLPPSLSLSLSLSFPRIASS